MSLIGIQIFEISDPRTTICDLRYAIRGWQYAIMGRIQKLREQKKIEQIEQAEQKSARSGKILKWGAAIVIAIALVVYGASLFKGEKTGETAPSQSPQTSATPQESLFPSLNPQNNQTSMENKIAVIETDKGAIKLELFSKNAPKTVDNFVKL
ncbi:MAG: hypothetical protein UV34_C0005G0001, partial [Parcubacteria group bacterium GW2011_GWB1_42_6]